MKRIAVVLSLALFVLLAVRGEPRATPTPADRKAAEKAHGDGNFKDAYDGYRKLALDPKDHPLQVGNDLNMALSCLQRLNRIDESDSLIEDVVTVHRANWRLLQAAGQAYLGFYHYGYITGGEFHRSHSGGGGRYVFTFSRDRVRALHLMKEAMEKIGSEKDGQSVANFYVTFASALMTHSGYGSWRLQELTDLAQLPDYDEGYQHYYGDQPGAPVEADGTPVYYKVAKSFDEARNDGERWRWALLQAVEYNASLKGSVRRQFANFLRGQFDVQTLRSYWWFFQSPSDSDEKTGPYAVHTLGEDETIARLATGVKRFKLPDEFNFIKIYKELAEDRKAGLGEQAYGVLADIFTNRRQYVKAASWWERSIKEYGDPNTSKRNSVNQIVGNWGRFEPHGVQPAGTKATIRYRFRNGTKVRFEATEIDVRKLLADVKSYLSSSPSELDWNKINIDQIGHRLVEQNETKYLGKQAPAWDLDLKPEPHHFDKLETITTPLEKAGAYLVKASMKDGNTCQVVVWITDTIIVRKPLQDQTWFYVADATTGAPIPGATLDFFGYRTEYVQGERGRDRHRVLTSTATKKTDDRGQATVAVNDTDTQYQWLITATDSQGRLAYLGFSGIWHGGSYDHEYNQTKTFVITDRPVYRPSQDVRFKFWIGTAKYDVEDASSYANRPYTVIVNDPKGAKIFENTITADAYGGLEGTFTLPRGAVLGVYAIHIPGLGGSSFRVEEYKKPEFEVTVEAPEKPVKLGEKITATIKAKYYFGAPVTKAKVKYKVLRSNHDASWYPVDPWDWLYGCGYWWYACDYPWYPGWWAWGCKRPIPWWWHGWGYQPPEVVAESEGEIGPDGTVKVEIDTALAAAVHGDKDHRYQITAEVTDESRRTIVGSGNVLAARAPFKVYVWVDRGYYAAGDTLHAHFAAQTLDHKPVKGAGSVHLFKITYNAKGEPSEKSVQQWSVTTNEQGRTDLKIKVAEPGQFRLSCKLTDDANHTIEGGYIFTVIGKGFTGAGFRYNDLELIQDRERYAPGEKVNLMINTDRADATVLLFQRPANGVYLAPEAVTLKGKSALREIAVTKKDMPNFFVEALTISNGKIHTQVKEIVVPPEERVVNVDVLPSAKEYKPGEEAKVKVRLTDAKGAPFVGSIVLSIYDKAVEYISGGSNVPEIRAFFWGWRRSHHETTMSNLQRMFGNLIRSTEQAMHDLGAFGGILGGVAGGPELDAQDNMRESKSIKKEGGKDLGAAFAAPKPGDKAAGEPNAEPTVAPTVRTAFADTAYWNGLLTSDKDGTAEVALKMPENLTGWKVATWAMGHGTRVGQGSAEIVTTKKLLLRLQAPRFFVEKDEVVLSANVHNYLAGEKNVSARLELDGKTLEPMGDVAQTVKIKSNGEARVDWRVKVVREGTAVIRMKALTDEESDAMEMSFPVYVHGMDKMVASSGVIRPDGETASFTIDVPAERRMNESRLEVRYSPSLAAALVDALPYLADYPYGCTEQTLNRFLPTVITQKLLREMGVDLAAVREKRASLNAQELGDPKERAAQWRQWTHNPVFDKATVDDMVLAGIKRLVEMQNSDGGWGWFSAYGEHSYPHTTAVVVHGLQIARENDVLVPPEVIAGGIAWLTRYQAEQVRHLQSPLPSRKPHADVTDALVFMILTEAGVKNGEMLDFLYRDRNEIPVYGKAVYGIALQKLGEQEKLAMILKNIEQFLVRDDENQTAYLNLGNSGWWWYWYGDEIETLAYYLKLLAKTDPKGWKAPGVVKYLLNNRKHATYWKSTRDTALCIEAMADYLRATGEDKPDMTVEIHVDGKKRKEVKIDASNLFTFDDRFVLVGDAVETGKHNVTFVKKGKGALYFNGYLSYFSLEDFITAAGLEIKVQRTYSKLVPVDKKINVSGDRGQVVGQKVEKYDKVPLANLADLKSGDLVEIELIIESKNEYEYLLFEDMKAAGFDPVELRSGYGGNSLGAYVEYRDDRVAFFVQRLGRGKYGLTYRMRAEIPGKFSALPARASAMYAPELRGNSDEIKLKIGE